MVTKDRKSSPVVMPVLSHLGVTPSFESLPESSYSSSRFVRMLSFSDHRRPASFPPSFAEDAFLGGVDGIRPRTLLRWLRREDSDRLARSLPEYERKRAHRLGVLRARRFHERRLLLHIGGSRDAPAGAAAGNTER